MKCKIVCFIMGVSFPASLINISWLCTIAGIDVCAQVASGTANLQGDTALSHNPDASACTCWSRSSNGPHTHSTHMTPPPKTPPPLCLPPPLTSSFPASSPAFIVLAHPQSSHTCIGAGLHLACEEGSHSWWDRSGATSLPLTEQTLTSCWRNGIPWRRSSCRRTWKQRSHTEGNMKHRDVQKPKNSIN
jgi:hypothetical protein